MYKTTTMVLTPKEAFQMKVTDEENGLIGEMAEISRASFIDGTFTYAFIYKKKGILISPFTLTLKRNDAIKVKEYYEDKGYQITVQQLNAISSHIDNTSSYRFVLEEATQTKLINIFQSQSTSEQTTKVLTHAN